MQNQNEKEGNKQMLHKFFFEFVTNLQFGVVIW